jgi:iron complex transport system ATP-binding protein
VTAEMNHVPTVSSREFLHLRNVCVARGDSIVLHNIAMDIAAGEHVAILGPNGCGKSSFIKTITCECYPIVQDGLELRIFGRDRWDLSELRKHLGLVSAELPGERTPMTSGEDAVVSGFFSSSTLWPHLQAQVTEEMRARAKESLKRMEASHLAHKLVGEMSAGERRRIQIARALVHNPEMLLLDEPSNALDLAAQKELRRVLRVLTQQGTGLLLVTHHLSDIIPEIDRVIMMKEGRIFADGEKKALLTTSVLQCLFDVKVSLVEQEGVLHSW